MFKSFGLPEIILILVIILLVFGAAKIPEIARSLGKAKGEFKKAQQEEAANEDKAKAAKAKEADKPS